MSDSLKPGFEHKFEYIVNENKTVPNLYPEAEEFKQMPEVFATGFLVGLVEWTCIQLINKHIDWPAMQSVGTDIKLNHIAATPPGFKVTVKVILKKVESRKLTFSFEAFDKKELISKGYHERFIINAKKFKLAVEEKNNSVN